MRYSIVSILDFQSDADTTADAVRDRDVSTLNCDEAIVHEWMRPFHFGEQAFMLWLLIMGAKPKPLASPAYPATHS
jgi:hypothetical protein